MNPRYSHVAERAGHRCEYCGAPEAVFNFAFEIEHVVPVTRGGTDDESNWALSCRACNVHKSDRREAIDEQTGSMVALFHPRRDRWTEHFTADVLTGEIRGLTSTGRATAACLKMNTPIQKDARRYWARLRLFP